MTTADCNKLMAMIKANYPAYHAKTDKATQAAAVTIMAMVLADLDYENCSMALVQYMAEPHEFPPNAGQLREIAGWLNSGYCPLNMPPIVERYHRAQGQRLLDIDKEVGL